MSWTGSIDDAALGNTDFRRVLSTGPHAQLVVMSIPAGGEIGEEVHPGVDQVLSIVDGSGEAVLDDVPAEVGGGDLVLVPAGAKHNLRNVGTGDLKLYTIYAPPQHPAGTVHRTHAEAAAAGD